jgi:sulfate permease, SulP family
MGKHKKHNKAEISTLQKYLPFLQWIHKLKDPGAVKKDIIAGITVALVLVPQSMAYAGLAWLPIEVGLYTAFIPVIIAGLFWSSSQMSTWPITIVSLMTATALAPIATAGVEWYVIYASILAFMTGIFYILLWFLRMWIIVEFLSHPVIVGFTNGVAILTIMSQVSKLFWVSVDKWSHFFEHVWNLISAVFWGVHIPTLIVWVLSMLLLFGLARFTPRIPRVLALLIMSISLSYYFWFAENYWGIIIKTIPDNIPSFVFPFFNEFSGNLTLADYSQLMMYAMIIGMIAFTQTISVAKFVWYQTKRKIHPNKELVSQWLANISSSLFGWYGVWGSFSKTAVNMRNGATTWFASVVTGLIVLVTIMYLTPLLYHLPFATLAAIIIVAVISLIKIQPIINAWKIEKHDAIIAIITFGGTLLLSPNLERAIGLWVILSLALYIYRTMRPKIVEVSMYKDGQYRDCELFWLKTSKCVSLVRVDGDLYFANASYFEDEILNLVSEKTKLKVIIFDFGWMNNVDSSGLHMIKNLVNRLQKTNIKVYMTNVRVRVTEKFHHTWFLEDFWVKNIFTDIDEAVVHVIEKFWDSTDAKILMKYKKDKKKKPELDKHMIKKIDKI